MALMKGQNQPFSVILKLSALLLVSLQFSPSLYAGEKEDRIINKAINAYGGDKLMQLKNLTYQDEINHFFDMQSGHTLQGPMSLHLNQYQIEVNIDLVNKRKAFRRASTRVVGNHGSENLTTTHRLFKKGKGFKLDHCQQTYIQADNINFANADLGFSQMLDPMIIKQLANDRENSQRQDTAYIQGHAHDVLTVNAGTPNEYTVYVNQTNGQLSRMLQKRGQLTRTYDFLDHQQANGIMWAKQLLVSANSQPIYHTTARNLSVNNLHNAQFNIPSGYVLTQTPQMLDVAQPFINELARGVYFLGQGWGYSLFIDEGDHYITAGAWHEHGAALNWQETLQLLRETTQNNKPVAKHIVTHHHTDHMAGLNEIVEHGANLVLHPSEITAVQKFLSQRIKDDRFEPIETPRYLADGKIMLFDVPTSHASHNLAIYLPEHKILFTEDIFGSSYESALDPINSWPNLDAYQRLKKLNARINELDLTVEHYVSSHHRRILTQADIDHALSMSCPTSQEHKQRLFQQAE
ncbi:MBL fold metallo-hydrolase [Thalassotalea fusca]